MSWSLGLEATIVCSLMAGVGRAEQPQQHGAPAQQPGVRQEVKGLRHEPGAKPAVCVELPAAIVAAFKQAYPGATIRGTALGTEDGRSVYAIESIERGMTRTLTYNADGSVLVIQEQVKMAHLPPAVGRAVDRLYPKATITLAERITRGRVIQYELSLKNAPESSVTFLPDGSLVLFEVEK